MKKIIFLFILIGTMMMIGCGQTDNSTQDMPNMEVEVTPSEEGKQENESLVIDTTVSSAQEALQLLKEGNARFVADDTEIINVSSAKRDELEEGQAPYAIIISCSDSRVTPTHIFNAGLGELFEIRVAGNVLDDYAMGSVEYGIEHLGCPLLVVMGHENCGAVTAAYEAYQSKKEVEGEIGELIEAILPSVKAVKGSSIEEASHANVRNTINELNRNPVVSEAVKEGKLTIVGAYYDLDGSVTFLD